MVTLVYDDTTVPLARQAVSDLADQLWKGERPGSVTSAAKLVAALALPPLGNEPSAEVAIEPYEVEAIEAALHELGLDGGAGRALH